MRMHPYRGTTIRIDDDSDVRAYARSARRLRLVSKSIALAVALGLSWLMIDWHLGARVLLGTFLH
jgi:hypothetical protein